MQTLPGQFYNRYAIEVARDLLGCRLIRLVNGGMIVAMITETEAYQGEEDQGCHARSGKTARTAIMYGPPGFAYIYFIYGMHWLLNVVTGEKDVPAAVLLRGIHPLEGQDIISKFRPQLANSRHWLDGPAKLTHGLSINGQLNGHNLTLGEKLFISQGDLIPADRIKSGPRVGLNSVPEPWKSVPWRFWIEINEVR